jgi:hypothetical protein
VGGKDIACVGCWGVLRYADIAEVDLVGIPSIDKLLKESIICSLESDIGVVEQEATLTKLNN